MANATLKRPHRCYGKCAAQCSGCGKTVHRGPHSRPEIICRECRGGRPGYQSRNQVYRTWTPEQRACPICAATFKQQRPGQKYCTLACRNRRPRQPKSEAAKERDRKRVRPARTCPVCEQQYHPTCSDQKTCSRTCAIQQMPDRRTRWPRCNVRYLNCAACGMLFVARSGRQRACGKGCSYQLLLVSVHRRHALLKELESEDIDLLYIYERDKWTCQLCHRRVRRTPRHKHDPLMASPDHIIPVSEGGATTYANLRCTHLRCNKSRGNRGGNEQLRLVG